MAARAKEPFVPRPPIVDRVTYGPLPTSAEYEAAHRAWRLPDQTLAPASSRPLRPLAANGFSYETRSEPVHEVLVANVLDALRAHARDRGVSPGEPPPVARDAQRRTAPHHGDGARGWAVHDFLPAGMVAADDVANARAAAEARPATWEEATFQGKRVMSPRSFTVAELRAALATLAVPVVGTMRKLDLQVALAQAQFAIQAAAPAAFESALHLLPQSDLSGSWGVGPRGGKTHLIPFRLEPDYSAWELYTWALKLSPYNPALWTSRAFLLFQQGHYDLALGDCHRALELIDTLSAGPAGRGRRPGLFARVWDALETHAARAARGP
ncbi:MAG: hypothetical protein M1832_004063, partial [Thelocarpon impressellum]